MKRIILTVYLAIACLFAFGQSFEGEIVYHNIYKSKIPSVNDNKLGGMMGTVENYYVKDGDYKSETNGTLMLWQLYINADNKLYNKLVNSETILWNDGSVKNDV